MDKSQNSTKKDTFLPKDIVHQLSYYVTNEARMPAGFVRTVIEEIESLRKQAESWQATAAGLAQDLSNAEDEFQNLFEINQELIKAMLKLSGNPLR
jgi:hypothetical protein